MEIRVLVADPSEQKDINKILKIIGYSYGLIILSRIIDFFFNEHTVNLEEALTWNIRIFFILQSIFSLIVPCVCYYFYKKVDFFKILMLLFSVASIGSFIDDVVGKPIGDGWLEIGLFIVGVVYTFMNYKK